MRKTIHIFIVLYSVFSCLSIHGQFSNEDCISTEGTDFWFTFPENGLVDSTHKTVVVITSRFDCDYRIELVNKPTELIQGNLKKDSITSILLPYEDVEAVGDVNIQSKGVHLTSSDPVSVYIYNYTKGSCDASMIYPTHLLDNEYYDFDYAAARGQGETDLFTLIATDDNTHVEIEINIGATRHDGTCTNDSITSYSINLNKGEVFPMNFCANPYMVSHIVANKPIAVYTGVRYGQNTYGGNLLTTAMFEQIPPVKLYSEQSIYIPNKPYLNNYENTFYGVGIAPPDVTVNGIAPLVSPRTANGFQVRYFGISTTQPMIIETSSPSFLQFAIYRNGTIGFNQSRLNILSTEFSTINAQFLSFPLSGIDSHYVNILVKNNDIGNLELDHIPISPSRFTPIPGSAFSYAQLNISSGAHLLRSTTPKASFQAYAYGVSLDGTNVYESYAYMLGFNNLVHMDLFDEESILTCFNSTQLLAKDGFRTYEWNTGETTRDITANSNSIYELKVESQNGCVYADSIEVVKVSNDDVYLGKDSTGCIPDSIPLEVSEYFENVLWNDGSTDHKRWIKDAGTYYTQIRVYDCTIGDTIQIGFQENPDVELTGDSLICDDVQSQLNVTYPGVNPINWQFDGNSEWEINSPTGTIANAKNSSAGIVVSDTGNYQISYKRISQYGCIQMDTHSMWFYKTPSSEINYVDTGNRCFEYERKIRYMGEADKNTRFYWDFGGCLKIDSVDNTEYTVTVGINNPNRFVSLITSAYGCTSPISKLPIGLTPTFDFDGEPNQSCDSLNIQFNSEVYIDDSVHYLWEFGDNNTSTAQNPSHIYVGANKYDVTLWITNIIDGCKNGFKKDAMIEVFQTPTASFSVKPSIALDKDPEIAFTGNFDRTYLHKWFFGDNDSSFIDSPTHWYNTPGEYTSSLIVFNEFGCSDTAYQKIIITPFFEIMPNAFRPDSDIEVNRTFKPVGIIEYADHYQLQVFNKWGRLVFETSDFSEGWDGNYHNGNKAPAGVYVYQISYANHELNIKNTKKGTVTLVR